MILRVGHFKLHLTKCRTSHFTQQQDITVARRQRIPHTPEPCFTLHDEEDAKINLYIVGKLLTRRFQSRDLPHRHCCICSGVVELWKTDPGVWYLLRPSNLRLAASRMKKQKQYVLASFKGGRLGCSLNPRHLDAKKIENDLPAVCVLEQGRACWHSQIYLQSQVRSLRDRSTKPGRFTAG